MRREVIINTLIILAGVITAEIMAITFVFAVIN